MARHGSKEEGRGALWDIELGSRSDFADLVDDFRVDRSVQMVGGRRHANLLVDREFWKARPRNPV